MFFSSSLFSICKLFVFLLRASAVSIFFSNSFNLDFSSISCLSRLSASTQITVTVEGGTTTEEVPQQPSSYAAQLTAFVAAIRDGVAVPTGPADSVANMEVIDAMYRAAGLDPRPATML